MTLTNVVDLKVDQKIRFRKTPENKELHELNSGWYPRPGTVGHVHSIIGGVPFFEWPMSSLTPVDMPRYPNGKVVNVVWMPMRMIEPVIVNKKLGD